MTMTVRNEMKAHPHPMAGIDFPSFSLIVVILRNTWVNFIN